MVFLLVAVIFALKQLVVEKQRDEVEETRREEVERLVNDVSELTTMRLKLARKLGEELARMKGVEVNAVTAQVKVYHEALGFEPGVDRPKPEGIEFLEIFIPQYACALVSFEKENCERDCGKLDPRNPKAINRILVTGHADLVDGFVWNRKLASRRAEHTIQSALDIASQKSCDAWKIGPYLEHRLHPAAAGQIEHCLEVIEGDSQRYCSTLPASDRSDEKGHRTVTLEVELVGEDLSGMALNLVALDATVSQNSSTKELLDTLEPMLVACVKGDKGGRPSTECAPIRIGSKPLARSTALQWAVERACHSAGKDASPDYCEVR